jgi:hypothetical protein
VIVKHGARLSWAFPAVHPSHRRTKNMVPAGTTRQHHGVLILIFFFAKFLFESKDFDSYKMSL